MSTPIEELLSGKTSHKTFAPLSGGQTLELVRVLRDENRALQAAICDLQKDLTDTRGGVEVALGDVKAVRATILQMQVRQAGSERNIEATQRELERAGEATKQLQTDLDSTASKVTLMGESMKHSQTQLDQVLREGDEVRDWLRSLQNDLERNFECDKSDRGEFNEVTNKLSRGQDAAAKGLEEYRQAQAAMEATLRKFDGDIDKQHVLFVGLEERLAEAVRLLKEARADLEETSLKGMRLEEEHNHTKAHVTDVSDQTRHLRAVSDRLGDHIRQTAAELLSTQQEVDVAQDALRSNSGRIQRNEGEIRRLGENHKATGNQLKLLEQNLSQTNAIAQQACAGLRETNALMLPNIAMDLPDMHAVGAQQRFGSNAGAGGGGAGAVGGASPTRARAPSRNGTSKLASLLSPLSMA